MEAQLAQAVDSSFAGNNRHRDFVCVQTLQKNPDRKRGHDNQRSIALLQQGRQANVQRDLLPLAIPHAHNFILACANHVFIFIHPKSNLPAMITILICSAIALIGLFLIFYAMFNWGRREGAGVTGVVIVLITGGIGFGMLCSLAPYSHMDIKANKFTFAKTESTVTVQVDDYYHTFNDAKTYNAISDSAEVYLRVGFNAYGYRVDSEIIVKKAN